MPYISRDKRQELGLFASPKNPGELNYLFTRLIVDYLVQRRLSYQTLNDVLGALEGAKQEFYRRVAVPYEEERRNINSDVYPTLEEVR